MFNSNYLLYIIISISFIVKINAQVGIGNVKPSSGTILDVTSSDKGVILPRIALIDQYSKLPLTENLTPGTMVYNTSTVGSYPTTLFPGYCYWDGEQWKRLVPDQFSLQFFQLSDLLGSNSYRTLPNLDQIINVPFTGIYQIISISRYNSRFPGTGDQSTIDTSLASVRLVINNTRIAESTITSASAGSLQALPSTVTIIRNVRLYQGVDYRFRVQGKEWQFSNNYGFGGEFGVNSTFYDGTNLDPDGSQSDASRASLTITLVKPE